MVSYAPDSSNSLFVGKTIIVKSGASSNSNHATHVAKNFYGTTSQIPGTCNVDVYGANDWIGTGFLNNGSIFSPKTETRAVQNHSWAGSTGSTSSDANISCRLDYAIDHDGFVCAVGLYNYDAVYYPNHPQLLCQTYNTISVGRDDGGHTTGLTTLDGSNRMKPDIVAPSSAPEYATSWTTPMVAGAAGLLHAKLSATPYSLTGADRPRVIKALLLASATKDTVPNWDNSSTSPLDNIYGAGELNTLHAYNALRAGRTTASNNTQYGIRGWAAETANNSAKTYYFTIPAGAPFTPFCASLTWHRSITNIFSWSASLANLTLRLHHANAFVTGSEIAASTSSVDNVELVYQSSMPPGQYALVVSKDSGSNTPFALAWHSLPAVTVAATVSTAREIDGQTGLVTFTRTGDTTLPLYVPLTIGGSAVSGSHYQALPSSLTIPAGSATATLTVTPVSDNLAQGSRTLSVAVAADFALVRDASQSAIVTIEDKPFDAWRFIHFPTQLGNPAISGENADPDGDGLPNLIEYALNLLPTASSISPVTTLDVSGYLALSAAKNPTATDITWGAQVSSSLDAWTSATQVINNTSTYQARDTILRSNAAKRFIRLKITRP